MKDMYISLRSQLEVRYPRLGEFVGLEEPFAGHLERYPHAPPPFLGPAGFQFYALDFVDQDEWNEMQLSEQKSRYC